ncbi:MAG TPA: BTAD domain-containing putative transcriptional regulator [Ktedonobacteraceae bacterium]|nr:BTAD domain-containing putative transcriptional regulator [Ktedonobacteraceae bacterium]
MHETLRVYLLGEFRLYRDGKLVGEKDWHTRQARQLLKLLLLHRGYAVSVGRLIDLLWPEEEYRDNAHKTLRSAVSTLRAVLEGGQSSGTSFRFIPRCSRVGYTFTCPPDEKVWIDSYEFERLLDAALKEQNRFEGTQLLQAALALYVGDLLAEDEDTSWAWVERTRLRERYFTGVVMLMERWVEDGCYNEAITVGRNALAFDACREPLYRLIMQCQAGLGDSAGALQTFEQCRRLLDQELGADPSPLTLQLHTAILQGTFQVRARVSAASVASEQGSGANLKPETKSVHGDGSLDLQTFVSGQQEPFCVGRKAQLHWFSEQLDSVGARLPQSNGPMSVVVLVGDAGVGKSFLGRLFLNEAQFKGFVTLAAPCQALEQHMSFAPLLSLLSVWLSGASDEQLHTLPRASLALIAPLLPELNARIPDLSPLSAATSEQAYSMLVTGLVEVFLALCREHPLLLFFDDVQWADESSLLVLNRLAHLAASRRHSVFPLLLLIACRSEDAGENTSLGAMLRYLRREQQVSVLNVSPFTPEEVTEYVALYHIDDSPHASFLSERLYQITQGNALFLVEAGRAVQEWKVQQEADSINGQASDTVTTSLLHSQMIRDVVLERIARLPQHAVELLEIAAGVGHQFSLDILRPVFTDDDYKALDMLLSRRFLVEVTGLKGYEVILSFSHELVRQVVYAACSTARLIQVHRSIAENMEKRYGLDVEPHSAEIAFHYLMAGWQYRFEALRYSVLAGDYARRIFHYRQALTYYDQAWQLLQQVMLMPQHKREVYIEEWRHSIYQGRGLAYEALLDWEGVQESHNYLSTSAATNGNMALLTGSSQRLAITRVLMGNVPEGIDIARTVLERLRADMGAWAQTPERVKRGVQILMDMALRGTYVLSVDEDAMIAYDEKMLMSGQFPAFCAPSPPLTQDWGEIIELLGAEQAVPLLTAYGLILLLQGLNADAERCLKKALQAAEETGHVMGCVHASMHLSRVYDLYGRQDEGTAWLLRSIERGQQLPEVSWVRLWPLLFQVYRSLLLGQVAEAEHALSVLQTQTLRQDGFLAQHYAIQIGLGLLAVARGEFEQANTLLREALTQRHHLYLETYILAEVGLASLAERQERYDEAYTRLLKMLAFCAQHSLLRFYSVISCSLARISLRMAAIGKRSLEHLQAVAQLLREVCQLVSAAGYAGIEKQCREMLSAIFEVSGQGSE